MRQNASDLILLSEVARDLLTANGSNFEKPPVNFYRAMQNRTPNGIAQTG